MKRWTSRQSAHVELYVAARLSSALPLDRVHVAAARISEPDRIAIHAEIAPQQMRGLVRHVVTTSIDWTVYEAAPTMGALRWALQEAARELYRQYHGLDPAVPPELGEPYRDDGADPVPAMLGSPHVEDAVDPLPAMLGSPRIDPPSWLDRLLADHDPLAEASP